MRNLILFFRKYRYFFVFVIIQFILLRSYFSNIHYPRTVAFSVSNSFNGWMFEQTSSLTEYWNLKDKNDVLVKENLKLKNQSKKNFVPLQRKVFLANDTIYHQQYAYLSAKVINDSYTNRNNFLTLNIGKINGVKKNMGVYNEAGIVGFVVNASDHYCLVKSILTENFNISAKLKTNNEHGLLKWDGKDPEVVQLTGVPKDVEINKGDTIVTKGGAAIFPENINVGVVKNVDRKAGIFSAFIDVTLLADLSSVYQVYVVRNLFKEEQLQLEKSIEKDVE